MNNFNSDDVKPFDPKALDFFLKALARFTARFKPVLEHIDEMNAYASRAIAKNDQLQIADALDYIAKDLAPLTDSSNNMIDQLDELTKIDNSE